MAILLQISEGDTIFVSAAETFSGYRKQGSYAESMSSEASQISEVRPRNISENQALTFPEMRPANSLVLGQALARKMLKPKWGNGESTDSRCG